MKNSQMLKNTIRNLIFGIFAISTFMVLTLGGPQPVFADGNDLNEYHGGPPAVPTDSKPCPWKITGLEVGRWMNGKLKASTWAHGSFPLTGWITERPNWYVNGTNIGKSWPFFNLKRLPNSSRLLRKGQNKIIVKFSKPPYAGASNTYKFNYDPNKIKPGQHIKF